MYILVNIRLCLHCKSETHSTAVAETIKCVTESMYTDEATDQPHSRNLSFPNQNAMHVREISQTGCPVFHVVTMVIGKLLVIWITAVKCCLVFTQICTKAMI